MKLSAHRRWWAAARRRDPAFDGAFVFGVVTTGVYCRPTCPARRPRPGNVRFFGAARAAEREGFRACRRCDPRSALPLDPLARLAGRACQFLGRHLEETVTLGRMARSLSVSPFHLQRTFKRKLGVSPREYLAALRFERFKAQAPRGTGVTAALHEAGFSSASRLYERSRTRLGMTPATYRKGAPGMLIVYTFVEGPLGRALVASTPQGLCSVELGDSDPELIRRLRDRYPRSRLLRRASGLQPAARQVARLMRGRGPDRSLPLDVQATAFQARVWKELQSIPCGQTRTYGEIARRLGLPRSARAVARACASNPVALVLPCHRAVAQSGDPAGYRWGIERKRALLRSEARGSRNSLGGAGARAARPVS